MDKFFAGKWNDFVYKFRIPIIAVFVIWTIIASIFAADLGPLTKEEEFLPDTHPITIVVQTL